MDAAADGDQGRRFGRGDKGITGLMCRYSRDTNLYLFNQTIGTTWAVMPTHLVRV
jgi:hypothetical protein